jgi:hypothetical protein
MKGIVELLMHDIRRRIFISLLAAIACSACHSRNVDTRVSADAWRADLRYLERELPRRHLNAFHTVSRERFAAEVAGFESALPRMNDDERLVGMMRIAALVGDGHTHLDLPPSFPRYPFELHWFGDELRVVATTAQYQHALGARVLGIGESSLESVMARASQLVPRGENDERTRFTATMLLGSPEVLHGLGLIGGREPAPFTLEAAPGERLSVAFAPARLGGPSELRMVAEANPPLYLQRLGEPLWMTLLPDRQTVYVSFSRYPPEPELRERAAALARLLDESHARRLVLDLRRNAGGDFGSFRQTLLPVIRERASVNRRGGLFVITGVGTFSAAMVNALDLRHKANAILVGSPTGARPNSYSEHGEFRLPNTGLRVSYSTRYYRFGADSEVAVAPDRQIEPTWEEFRAGRDPALEWILSDTSVGLQKEAASNGHVQRVVRAE